MHVNFDVPARCPVCDDMMQCRLSIWVIPGNEHIDIGEIDYETDVSCDSEWWCQTCGAHHFPKDQDESEVYLEEIANGNSVHHGADPA